MATAQMRCVTQHLRRLLAHENAGDLPDGELLDRFVMQGDDSAFAVLVRRHGAMVLGVCRRALGNLHDAEDAFQATFLVLARKAASIRRHTSVASWLYAVAHHLALKARTTVQRRFIHETQVRAMLLTDPPNAALPPDTERHAILDEELRRLPDKYRAALVLCYLEGRSRREAATQLGWKPGAVKIRLERGRDLLRQRLTRRGLALSGAAVTALLEANALSAGVSAALVDATVRAAVCFTTGQAAAAGMVSEHALALAEGMRKTMLLTKIKIATAVLLTASLLGAGTTWLAHAGSATDAPAHLDNAVTAEVVVARQAVALEDKAAGTDAQGDPLPPGVRARLGTIRGRHESNVGFIAYTADGRHLVTGTQAGAVRLLEAASGKEVRLFVKAAEPNANAPFNMPRGGQTQLALAPDGKTLAVASQGTKLTLYDVATGQAGKQWKAPNAIMGVAFAADSKSLVTRNQDQVLRHYDLEGKEIGKFASQAKGFGNGPPVFSPDGKVIACSSSEQANNQFTPLVRRWEVNGAKELPAVKGAEAPFEYVVLAPELKTMAWVSIQAKSVRLWDMENNKELRKLEDATSVLAFSPDGKLAVGRNSDLLLCLWDTGSGKVMRNLGTGTVAPEPLKNVQATSGIGPTSTSAAFTRDSKHVAVGLGTVVRQWEVATGKEVGLAAGHSSTVANLALAPDGKTVISRGQDHTVRIWDLASASQQQQFAVPAAMHAAFSADGQFLALGNSGTLHVWDARAGKEIKQWKGHDKGLVGLALSSDGKMLASRSRDRTIRLWEARTGKELHNIADPVDAGGANPGGAFGAANFDSNDLSLLFAPDGAILAALPTGGPSGYYFPQRPTPKDNTIRLWDVATGKMIRRFDENKSFMITSAYSPDGRTIATANSNNTISLWEVITGKERLQFKTDTTRHIHALAFSADGKFLVGGGPDATVRFWDAVTGKELAQRKGHQSGIVSIVLSDDGKTLVSGSVDTTALVYDVPPLDLTSLKPMTLDGKQTEALWADLAGNDAAKANQSIRALAAAPQQALPFLKDHVKPVPQPDAQRIPQLLKDLQNEQFAVRQKAEEELEKLGELAEPALNKLLDSQPALETKSRVQKLVEKIVTQQTLPQEMLRGLRALAVLELIGTPEARQQVDALGQGAAGARLTKEAKAVLQRIARR
jgi:RNA polymerase sigma factor (sigma-70 family)